MERSEFVILDTEVHCRMQLLAANFAKALQLQVHQLHFQHAEKKHSAASLATKINSLSATLINKLLIKSTPEFT